MLPDHVLGWQTGDLLPVRPASAHRAVDSSLKVSHRSVGDRDRPDKRPPEAARSRFGSFVHAVVEWPLFACAVRRRRFPVGASPTRRTLQPEATGAVMEVTKWLKPSV